MKPIQSNQLALGIASATGAYVLWGVLPIYWKLVNHINPQEILAHRIVWSFLFMVLIILATGMSRSVLSELRIIVSQPAKVLGVIITSVLITINWFTYIWAVTNNQEKLSFWQIVSFILTSIAVLNMILHFGTIPWIALTLAFSFGLYGLFKKMVNLGAIIGITLETLAISPIALLFLGYVRNGGNGAFTFNSPVVVGLLMGAGVVTAIPLILFASGANRLPLNIIGFLQYVAPTIMLFLGIFLYHETFTTVHLASFTIIWLALIIFTLAKTNLFLTLEPKFFKRITYSRDRANN